MSLTREQELFARVVAQQQQITALHTALTKALADHGEAMPLADQREIEAALQASEPAGRIAFEAAVAEAISPRVAIVRAELEATHAAALAAKEADIVRLSSANNRPDLPGVGGRP